MANMIRNTIFFKRLLNEAKIRQLAKLINRELSSREDLRQRYSDKGPLSLEMINLSRRERLFQSMRTGQFLE